MDNQQTPEADKTVKHYFMIGTVAELIKLLPIIIKFQEEKTNYKIIASGQNNIGKDLDLLKMAKIQGADITLTNETIKQTPVGLFMWFIRTYVIGIRIFYKEFGNPFKKKLIYIIVHGDTITTLLGTLLAKMFRLKVAHVEAGLRSFNYLNPFPEEITRVIVSGFADIHFCPNEWAINNLKNRKGVKVDTHYNSSIETLEMALGQQYHSDVLDKIQKQPYFIFLMHRNEHLINTPLFKSLINTALEISNSIQCVFILHKPTRLALERVELLDAVIKNDNIIPVERLPYIEFMKTLESCEYIITDGGSTQEEATFLGKPCLLIRAFTERIEGLGENVVLSKNDIALVRDFVLENKNYQRPRMRMALKPSSIIYNNLVTRCNTPVV